MIAFSHGRNVGLQAYQPEKLSRADFTFDYHLPVIDFDEDNFVSSFAKDNQHRKHGKVQTFRLGEGDFGLRIYNKCDEIQESSAKPCRVGTSLCPRGFVILE
ncbi:MAG: hypothetical protein WAT12_11020 [Candidatus Nitrotoga sp.]